MSRQYDKNVSAVMENLLTKTPIEALAFYSFVEKKIHPSARIISEETGADYAACARAAIRTLTANDRMMFDRLCQLNSIETVYDAGAVLEAVEFNEETKVKGSRGEQQVNRLLKGLGIEFVREKKFEGLGNLRFDFFIKKLNAIIEYDGAQHSMPVAIFGGERGFVDNLRRDQTKNRFCEDNGIRLLRIPHTSSIESEVVGFLDGLQ